MNERIGALYVAVIDNEVICFETNLKLFVTLFTASVPKARNYDWFYRAFKKEKRFSQIIDSKEYYFQKLGH
jgi:hypothetical protein